MWVSLVLVFLGIREGHVLIVVFILFWKELEGSFLRIVKLLFSMNSWILS